MVHRDGLHAKRGTQALERLKEDQGDVGEGLGYRSAQVPQMWKNKHTCGQVNHIDHILTYDEE